ncbi:1187_t:CDS:1 [Scutellospora calospora]|uniref:1187_t:CDS:1 n=1 Tax=Scutellospora calospora TaxID=85575 RepID=A0ACA9MCW2_9GLOM|nr:1187_t:CDS:1 [Scutellospora calospora]
MDTATAIFIPKDGDPAQSLAGQFNFTQTTPTKVHVSGQLTSGMPNKDIKLYRFWIVSDILGMIFYELTEGFIKSNEIEGWSINDNGGTSILQSDEDNKFSVKGTHGIVDLRLQISLDDNIIGSAQIKEEA